MTAPVDKTGNAPLFSRVQGQEIMARALGREMRAQRQTNEQVERLSGLKERRIETLRSFTEEAPVHFEEVLSLAAVLGPRFVSGLLSEINMYAAEYRGASPEKIGAEIIELAHKLTGTES